MTGEGDVLGGPVVESWNRGLAPFTAIDPSIVARLSRTLGGR